jgi:hypothetical protein
MILKRFKTPYKRCLCKRKTLPFYFLLTDNKLQGIDIRAFLGGKLFRQPTRLSYVKYFEAFGLYAHLHIMDSCSTSYLPPIYYLVV